MYKKFIAAPKPKGNVKITLTCVDNKADEWDAQAATNFMETLQELFTMNSKDAVDGGYFTELLGLEVEVNPPTGEFEK